MSKLGLEGEINTGLLVKATEELQSFLQLSTDPIYSIFIPFFSFLTSFNLNFCWPKALGLPPFCNEDRSYCPGPVFATREGDLH